MKCGWNKDTAKNRKAGSLPSYAKNIERVAKQSKLLRGIGQFSIALDVAHSGFKIHEACTVGREEECTKMKYTEGGRLTSSLIGGSAGVWSGYAACNLAFGIETAGTSLLWCAFVVGGAGGYLGGREFGEAGQVTGTAFYEVIENE